MPKSQQQKLSEENAPKDKLFKVFLSKKFVALQFLEAYLPKHILRLCDLKTLREENKSYISAANRDCHSDMLFSLQIEGKKAYVYVLVEHQSRPDPLMALRMLRYQVEIMFHHVENHKNDDYPLVVPLVFYVGDKPWNYPTKIVEYFADPQLAQELLFNGAKLIKLHEIPDAELLKHKDLGMLEFGQKHIHEKDAQIIIETLGKVFFNDKIDKELRSHVLQYTLQHGNIRDGEDFLANIAKKTPKFEGEIMNIASYLENKGRTEGMQQGMQQVARNMLAAGIAVETVSSCTGLNKTALKKLQADSSVKKTPTKHHPASRH